MQFKTSSVEETKALGRRVAKLLVGGENLLLVGDLGSGKTAFAQGIAEGLGITEPVKSPTYTYLREYEIPNRQDRLAHYDLYRLADKPTESELASIEMPERMADEKVVTMIEWADKISKEQKAGTCYTFEFRVDDVGIRSIKVPRKYAGVAV